MSLPPLASPPPPSNFADLPLWSRSADPAGPRPASATSGDARLPTGFHRLRPNTIYCEHCGGLRGAPPRSPPAVWTGETGAHARRHVVGEVMRYRFGRGQVPAHRNVATYLLQRGLTGEHDQWGSATLKAIGHVPDPAHAPMNIATDGSEVAEDLPWGLHWFDRDNVEEALAELPATAAVTRRWLQLLLPAVDLHLETRAPWWMAVAASLIEQGERVRSGSFREVRVHNVRRVGGRNVRDAGRVLQDPGLPGGLIERASGSRWTRDPTLVARARAEQRSVVFGGRRDEFDGDLLLVDHVSVGGVPPWLRPFPLFEIDRAADLAERIRTLRAALCRSLGREPAPGAAAPAPLDAPAREVGFADADYDAFRGGAREVGVADAVAAYEEFRDGDRG